MPAYLFYLFAFVAVVGALGVIINRNPVSSAFSLIVSFLGVAALFVGMNAYFVGTIQVLVYAGAIMVLFLFIIMLLDLRAEEVKKFHLVTIGVGSAIGVAFVAAVGRVLAGYEKGTTTLPKIEEGTDQDVQAIGEQIFTHFNFELQVIGVLLLVATIGVVVLSKKELN